MEIEGNSVKMSRLRLFLIKLKIRIPYITIGYDKYQKRVVIGFGLLQLGIGCISWSTNWESIFKQTRWNKLIDRKYIFVERHNNGDWWFHPRCGYYRTKRQAEKAFKSHFGYDSTRPHKILKLTKAFPSGYEGDWQSWVTSDLEHFIQINKEIEFNICQR